jgi:hypothetical protein
MKWGNFSRRGTNSSNTFRVISLKNAPTFRAVLVFLKNNNVRPVVLLFMPTYIILGQDFLCLLAKDK